MFEQYWESGRIFVLWMSSCVKRTEGSKQTQNTRHFVYWVKLMFCLVVRKVVHIFGHDVRCVRLELQAAQVPENNANDRWFLARDAFVRTNHHRAINLSKKQSNQLESIQKRAIRIIYQKTRHMPYHSLLYYSNITSLQDRRSQQAKSFFTSILGPIFMRTSSPPAAMWHVVTSSLRLAFKFPLPFVIQSFYRAACNATHGIAVAILSVRPSVRCVYCHKTKRWTADILIPHETAITLVFRHQ